MTSSISKKKFNSKLTVQLTIVSLLITGAVEDCGGGTRFYLSDLYRSYVSVFLRPFIWLSTFSWKHYRSSSYRSRSFPTYSLQLLHSILPSYFHRRTKPRLKSLRIDLNCCNPFGYRYNPIQYFFWISISFFSQVFYIAAVRRISNYFSKHLLLLLQILSEKEQSVRGLHRYVENLNGILPNPLFLFLLDSTSIVYNLEFWNTRFRCRVADHFFDGHSLSEKKG